MAEEEELYIREKEGHHGYDANVGLGNVGRESFPAAGAAG
jgi:hypothetical protein